MVDLLQSGATWLAGQLKNSVSQSVVYRRGASFVTLSGTISHQQREVENTAGNITLWENWDLIITAADLILSSSVVLPKRGDTWERTVGSELHVYEVLSLPGEDVYRYSDSHHTMLRIHSKLKSKT